MDRQDALKLLDEFVKTESLRKHLLAVETAMGAYARRYREDEQKWRLAGLLHDFDWEACSRPEEHPHLGTGVLKERGWPEEIVRAVLSHGDHTGIPRESLMEKVLFAVDELTGFITAVALVRPSKSLDETEASSVRKKMKDKAFARNVNRDDLLEGAQELGVEFDEHVAFVIEALKPVARELGLQAGVSA